MPTLRSLSNAPSFLFLMNNSRNNASIITHACWLEMSDLGVVWSLKLAKASLFCWDKVEGSVK